MHTLMVVSLSEGDASTSVPSGSTAPVPLSPVAPTLNRASSGCGSPLVPPLGIDAAAAAVAKRIEAAPTVIAQRRAQRRARTGL
jgi:hypothetical protein